MHKVDWPTLKAFIDQKNLKHQFITKHDEDIVYAIDGNFSVFSEIHIDSADYNDWNSNYKPQANKTISKLSSTQGIPEVSIRKAEGNTDTIVSHDLTKRSSWHQESEKITGEILTTSDDLTYQSIKDIWVNVTSGNIYNEFHLCGRWVPVIYVDNIEVSSGYIVNHDSGSITFNSSQAGSVVKADYHYPSSSLFSIIPKSGQTIMVQSVKLDFAANISFTSSLNFEIWGYDPSGQVSPPEKVPYIKIKYKNIKDIRSGSNESVGFFPPCDVLTKGSLVAPFNWSALTPLFGYAGMEMRIYSENDVEMGGEWGRATFFTMEQ